MEIKKEDFDVVVDHTGQLIEIFVHVDALHDYHIVKVLNMYSKYQVFVLRNNLEVPVYTHLGQTLFKKIKSYFLINFKKKDDDFIDKEVIPAIKKFILESQKHPYLSKQNLVEKRLYRHMRPGTHIVLFKDIRNRFVTCEFMSLEAAFGCRLTLRVTGIDKFLNYYFYKDTLNNKSKCSIITETEECIVDDLIENVFPNSPNCPLFIG